ncbi:MAG: indolepyruvate oxidoreductase subunit beta [Clostridiaceae bacterium]|nr:indolepyruvate oxidoreductase subunit beta [Eubacteriales bacterium]
MRETKSILLVGVGGQGTLLVSRILTKGLIEAGYDVKMSEVHGMAQRGGSVSTQVRYGDKVHSPIIGRGGADALVAFEKMEALRYAEYLKPSALILVNDYALAPMPVASGSAVYPEETLEAAAAAFETRAVKAADIARGLGNAKCMNVVLLGAMVKALKLPDADWEALIKAELPEKLRELNLKAFRAGLEAL